MSSQAVTLICDHCGIAFKSRYSLSCHIKSKHENTFKYTCHSCGRGFKCLWNFQGHLRSHKDALKESCSVAPRNSLTRLPKFDSHTDKRVCLFIGMGLITVIDYWNGLSCAVLSTSNVIYMYIIAYSSHRE